ELAVVLAAVGVDHVLVVALLVALHDAVAAALDRAGRGTSVVIRRVAVVAGFSALFDAVAAAGAEAAGHVVSTVRGAGECAARESLTDAVAPSERRAVALFHALDHPVAASLGFAGRGAAVAVRLVAVVAG